MVVAACNSASALPLDTLAESFDVPMLGVIKPGAATAVQATRNGKIGVIGTRATVDSCAYATAIHALNPDLAVFQQACPIFVSMVEEGWVDKDVTHMVVKEYLQPLKGQGVDVLLLGCTHYPLMKQAVAQFMGDDVALVDSGSCCAREMERLLHANSMKNNQSEPSAHTYFVTDMPDKFKQLGEQFLGRTICNVQSIDHIEEDICLKSP